MDLPGAGCHAAGWQTYSGSRLGSGDAPAPTSITQSPPRRNGGTLHGQPTGLRRASVKPRTAFLAALPRVLCGDECIHAGQGGDPMLVCKV